MKKPTNNTNDIKTNGNEPAFDTEGFISQQAEHNKTQTGNGDHVRFHGLTIRAYLAAKNCAAMVSSIQTEEDYVRTKSIANIKEMNVSQWIASESVKQADALIEALNKE